MTTESPNPSLADCPIRTAGHWTRALWVFVGVVVLATLVEIAIYSGEAQRDAELSKQIKEMREIAVEFASSVNVLPADVQKDVRRLEAKFDEWLKTNSPPPPTGR